MQERIIIPVSSLSIYAREDNHPGQFTVNICKRG
jgi:hypothetical protein